MSEIEKDCREKNVRYVKSGEVLAEAVKYTIKETEILYNGLKLSLPFIGEHQLDNAKAALAALGILKGYFSITDENIINGFKNAKNPARLELMSENPLILLDGAHNPDGIKALKNAVEKYNPKKSASLILGMLADKDSETSIKILEGAFDTVYTVPVDNPRSLSSEKLAERCIPHFKEVKVYGDVKSALEAARSEAEENDSLLVIAGSLYLAGEIRPLIKN